MEINKQLLRDWLIEQENKELKRGNIHAASGYNHAVHELLSGRFDSRATQQEELEHIAREQRERHELFVAIQTLEKERDIAVKALKRCALPTTTICSVCNQTTAIGEDTLAKEALTLINSKGGDTDAPKDTNGLS